ncbi:FKBP-type peptidyl-prolyl cis-trans isomerase [Georgenia sp. TF02-10]|uniref:FKBP-type peptidyl-prolyl cis-trans isomerase n=1 Tax=Georgenia sp. TF02-10 TaxID=2917725 RepID=UPI00352F6AE7
MHRRPTVLTALAAAAALTLAGCGGGDPAPRDEASASAEETTTAEATPAGTELPTVDGAFGEAPTITFPGSGAPADLQVDVLEAGDGAEVGADDTVVANYVGQVWDGEVFDSSFERGAPANFNLNGVVKGWKEGLTGTHVGDRVLLAIPADLGYGDEPPEGGVIKAGDSLVFVVDVLGTYAADAAGDAGATPVEPAPELPVTVEGGPGEQTSITVAEGAAAPAEPVVTVVATGSGEPVPAEAGTIIAVQFAETLWDNSKQSSTWNEAGPQFVRIGEGTVFDQLAGTPVGSRVVFQLPAQEASENAPASPGLAAVVDVLGAHAPNAA